MDNFEQSSSINFSLRCKKICLRSDFANPYILWGNSANGVMPPMPRCRLYQCRFNAKLCHKQNLKEGKVFYMTQTSFADIKSISFSIIPWHSKMSMAIKHRFSGNEKNLFDFHRSYWTNAFYRNSNKTLILLVV